MEAIGQLTGGVAHDFNNLLTVIMGGLETISRQTTELPQGAATGRIQRSAAMAAHAADRAATLTARLLAFSRRQPLDPKPVDPGRLVTGLADMLQRTLGETVALQTVVGAGLWRTLADPAELENALVNLAVNARDAMPGGGRLTIETSNAYLDETYVASIPEPVGAGQYVLIAVSDTGAGMDEDTLARVFEPFFTTKAVGKGTGLGLSQVYGFVRQSGGHVRIYSEVGEGTTVKIYLPRLAGAASPAEIEERAASIADVRGDETVLVVEDHEDLRAYSVSVLTEAGYRVLEASSGPEALALLARGSRVELLFTDVVLPDGMDGRRLADEAAKRNPRLKVLYTTGYTRNAIVHNGRLDPGVQLITKPFTSADLTAKVRQVLDG
jgi:CheY-like chemotaxis protein